MRGLLRPSAGEVRLGGAAVTGQPAHRRARRGLCLIPEGRGIFPSLTVRENLEIEIPPWVKDAALGRALEVHAADSAAPGGVGVIDLDDRLIPAGEAQFAGAKQPFEKAARIAQALPLDALQASQWQIGDCKSIQRAAS